MRAYKLFRVRRDGTIGPLFINKKQRIPVGEWMCAEEHPDIFDGETEDCLLGWCICSIEAKKLKCLFTEE